MHSYKSDIADVLCIKFVSGSMSFLPKRGSNGVNAPNFKHIQTDRILNPKTIVR